MILVPPMVDDVETVRRLQLLANMSPKLVGKSNDETAFDYDRELVRGAIFCAMCSSFEFGLRQIIHAMAFSLEIDSADLWKLNSGGIKQIESYLSGKGYLLNLFMDQNWKDAKSLADLRNLYAHSDGWSDVN